MCEKQTKPSSSSTYLYITEHNEYIIYFFAYTHFGLSSVQFMLCCHAVSLSTMEKCVITQGLCITVIQSDFSIAFCISPLCTAYDTKTLLDSLSFQKLRVPTDLLLDLHLHNIETHIFLYKKALNLLTKTDTTKCKY